MTRGHPVVDFEERGAQLRQKGEQLAASGVKFVQMEFADVNGHVRGKISPLVKALSPSGFGISTLIQTILSNDQVCLTPYSNFENCFPKLCAIADPETFRQWSWKPHMASVRCDIFNEDGTSPAIDPRSQLKKIEADLAAHGVEVKAALEYEFFLFQEDDKAVRERRYADLLPFGRSASVYNLASRPWYGPFVEALFERSECIGLKLEAFHTEYGEGMFEYVHDIGSALEAADAAAHARLHLKQLAGEHGLIATYMPVIGRQESDTASGAHHNISLWRDGRNLMQPDENGALSTTARQFAAGILNAMSDLHLIFRPWVNSYRRMDRHHFSPENASWGFDHHTAALRVVHGPTPARTSRYEVRVPGADVNPYLCMAAILGSGLHGIENGMEPPAYAVGDPVENGNGEMFPRTYSESIARFEKSTLARSIFGDFFVDIYTETRKVEWEAFKNWLTENPDVDADRVTQWERIQYFEWL